MADPSQSRCRAITVQSIDSKDVSPIVAQMADRDAMQPGAVGASSLNGRPGKMIIKVGDAGNQSS